jgi:hypothetical protein
MYITRIVAKTDYINRAERYVENLEKIFPDVAEISTGLALANMDMANFGMAEKILKKLWGKIDIPYLHLELMENSVSVLVEQKTP